MKLQDMTPEQILQKCAYDHGFNDALDVVLEIIDTQLEALADGKYGGASALNYVYEAVLALR